MVEKTKKVKSHTRRTKSGKTVVVRAHSARYDAAEEDDSPKRKRGAGKEYEKTAHLAADIGFTQDDFKEWYHWDTEDDPDNEAAKKVEKALIKQMGKKAYREYYDEVVDSYSARGHNKGWSKIVDTLKKLHPQKDAPKKGDSTKKGESATSTPQGMSSLDTWRKRINDHVNKAKTKEAKMKALADEYVAMNKEFEAADLGSRQQSNYIGLFHEVMPKINSWDANVNLRDLLSAVGDYYDFSFKGGYTPKKASQAQPKMKVVQQRNGLPAVKGLFKDGETFAKEWRNVRPIHLENKIVPQLEKAGYSKVGRAMMDNSEFMDKYEDSAGHTAYVRAYYGQPLFDKKGNENGYTYGNVEIVRGDTYDNRFMTLKKGDNLRRKLSK